MLVNHYEVLGIGSSATLSEIKAAHTRLLRQVHPDTGGNNGLFVLVQAAWTVLSDPKKRAAYDRELKSNSGAGSGAGAGSNSSPSGNGRAQDENFRRGYQEESGREQFRRDEERRRAEEAARQQEESARQAARDRAEYQARAERERATTQAYESRVLPYNEARQRLKNDYLRYHTVWHAPLQSVLRWSAFDTFVKRLAVVVAIATPLVVAWIAASTVSGPVMVVFVFVFNAVVVGFGLAVLLAILGYLCGRALTFLRWSTSRRLGVSSDELREEYLRGIGQGR